MDKTMGKKVDMILKIEKNHVYEMYDKADIDYLLRFRLQIHL